MKFGNAVFRRADFFKGLGLRLMTIESTIMLDILDKTTEAGKPALGIHDAVLCLKKDKDYVKKLMNAVYRDRLGLIPLSSKSSPGSQHTSNRQTAPSSQSVKRFNPVHPSRTESVIPLSVNFL
jgi:hypothetical protein